MPNAHPRPWHRHSVFGDGPRRPLDREQRARFRFLINAHRRAHRLTPHAELVGNALLKRLGVDGQCDPSHQTLAGDAACDERTVRRALDRLKALGMVRWVNRIVRDGWRAAQTSNAYLLAPSEVANPPAGRARRCAGHSARQTRKEDDFTVPAPPRVAADARAALARRRAAIEGRLLGKGMR